MGQGIPQMDTETNFVDYFDIDLTSHVLAFLNDPADLLRASAVSRSWREFVIANGLFKKLWMRKVPDVAHIDYVAEESNEIILSEVASRDGVIWSTLEREHKIYSSLLLPLAKPIICPKNCLSFPIGASSTDHREEIIINTMTSIDRYRNGASYWSSKGQVDPDVPEYVLYKLQSDMSILTEVNIRPFEAFWEPGKPVYSPKSVRFRLGHLKSISDVELEVCPVDHPSVDKYVWTYTSPEFPVTQEACLQHFKLPEPVVCVGGIFQVELLGRAQMNESDGLFYICLGYIEVMGQSLSPAYTLEMLKNGDLQLKFDLRSVEKLLQKFSREFFLQPVDKVEDGTRDEIMPQIWESMYQMVERLFEGED